MNFPSLIYHYFSNAVIEKTSAKYIKFKNDEKDNQSNSEHRGTPYSTEDRLRVLEYLKNHTRKEAIAKFGVSDRSIKRWVKDNGDRHGNGIRNSSDVTIKPVIIPLGNSTKEATICEIWS